MKLLGYILIIVGVLHAGGSLVGNAPGKIVISAVIAGIGVALVMKAKKRSQA